MPAPASPSNKRDFQMPPMPAGYSVDSVPPLPHGYTLDAPVTSDSNVPDTDMGSDVVPGTERSAGYSPLVSSRPIPPDIIHQYGQPSLDLVKKVNLFGGSSQSPDIARPNTAAADFAAQTGQGLANVSAPNIALQLVRKMTGRPNTLSQLPTDAALAFATMAAGGEGAGENMGARSTIPELQRATAARPAGPAAVPAKPAGGGGILEDVANLVTPTMTKRLQAIGKLYGRMRGTPETTPTPPQSPASPPVPVPEGRPTQAGEWTGDLRGISLPSSAADIGVGSGTDAYLKGQMMARALAEAQGSIPEKISLPEKTPYMPDIPSSSIPARVLEAGKMIDRVIPELKRARNLKRNGKLSSSR